MSYPQNLPAERTVLLTKADVPAVGLTYQDVVVKYKKAGATTFSTKVLIGSDFQELGNGMYTLKFAGEEMNTVGNFVFTITGPRFDNFIYDEFTVDPISASAQAGSAPGICTVSGTINGIDAKTASLLKITFKPVEFPARYNMSIISSDAVWTFPDSYGNFSVALVRGATVLVEIQRAGIRAQITIPDAPTANLIELLPPFTIDYTL